MQFSAGRAPAPLLAGGGVITDSHTLPDHPMHRFRSKQSLRAFSDDVHGHYVGAGARELRPNHAGDDGCEPDALAEANSSREGLNGA